LIEKDVIEIPPLDVKQLVRKAGRSTDAFAKLAMEERISTSVPTISTAGQRIESEVPGFPTSVAIEAIPSDDAEMRC
jgi:hypothetical protein